MMVARDAPNLMDAFTPGGRYVLRVADVVRPVLQVLQRRDRLLICARHMSREFGSEEDVEQRGARFLRAERAFGVARP